MGTISGYIYAAVWLIIAVYLFFYAFKSHKILFLLSGYFLFMSGWYLSNELITTVNLFEGIYSWIFRGIAVVVLIVCAIVYAVHKKRKPDVEQSD